MNFAVGDRLLVDGEVCDVVGSISYRNIYDNSMWMEYRLISQKTGREKWLSYDEEFREYSVSEVTNSASTAGFHEVDRGQEEVMGAWGDVDVEIGDKADFVEFEDVTEEKIISWETWDDGLEVSAGYYLDENEVERIGQSDGRYGGDGPYGGGNPYGGNRCTGGRKTVGNGKMIILLLVIFFGAPILSIVTSVISAKSQETIAISKYLNKSPAYTYVTSITGSQNEKADVYQTIGDIDWAAKDIIETIDGNTVDVQQNTEEGDGSVAILTSKEYCLIYTSEDGDTLVQISTRKYAYYNDDDHYRSDTRTRRYYRGFYYSRGYSSDASSYSTGSSPYDGYTGDVVGNSASDNYSSYSDSVRQASVDSRYSSGGGTSSGK